MSQNKLTASEKIQSIAILVGVWLGIGVLHSLAQQPKPMSQIMQIVGMIVILWTVLAAVFSLVFLIKTLLGKSDKSWKAILLPALGLWLIVAIYANI